MMMMVIVCLYTESSDVKGCFHALLYTITAALVCVCHGCRLLVCIRETRLYANSVFFYIYLYVYIHFFTVPSLPHPLR